MPPTAAPQFPSLPNFDLETINNAISSLTQIRNRATSTTTTTTTTTTTPAPLIPEPADIGARLGEVGLQVANNIFDPCEVQVSRYLHPQYLYYLQYLYLPYYPLQERGARRFVSRIVGGVNTVLGVNPCL